ncbi:MAG: TonB-dependent receptor [Chitinophagaceae bacterium]
MRKEFFVVAATFISSSVFAQQPDSSQARQLDEVVVTANKFAQKLSSTGKVLTVINRAQLERNTGRTLAQVLNEQAGLIINGAQGPLGTNQLIYMRGAGAANTLILIDGVPANDASGVTAEFDINHFAIDQIERVEILKGAQSVLYGSDAVAGVINIITKKQGSSKPAGFNATLAGGSYGTFKGTAGVGGKTKAVSYNLQYSRLQSDGFSAAYDQAKTGNFDRDGFKQDILGANVGLQATKNWLLRAYAQYGKYKADVDDGAMTDDKNNTLKNKNLQLTLSSVNQFTAGSVHVNLNLNNTERSLNDEKNIPADPNDFDPFNGVYKGKSLFAEAYTNLNLAPHAGLLFGADLRRQHAAIETTYGKLGDDSLKSTQSSGYTSFFLKDLSGFNAELGARYTHHSVFGSAFTYSINPSFLINKQVKLFANIASGFRAPSLYNLGSEYGNAALKPEKSMSYEGGVQYVNTRNTVNLRATYFNRTIKNVIIFKSLFVAPYGQYDNADQQHDHGFELEATIRPTEKWNIVANYAFTDGKVSSRSAATANDTSFYNLYRRPKNAFNTSIGYQASSKLYTSIGLRWVDKRDDLFFNSNTFATEKKVLGAYYNLDVYASYQAVRFVKFFADLRNITNQQYFDLYGYNSRRFNFMAGAMFNF